MPLPERLGRLRRVDRLGSGGFATVWLYHDPELSSDVAVKALAENWSQRLDVRERFLEEARILRRADSDHIVRVYDVGEADGTPYFVMTYADRGSLQSLVEPGLPLPPARVVELVDQAAAGLGVLHEHGVVHRDIKPQNLLLRSTSAGGDRLLVADLGVAKAMLHASGLTQVVGTPAYMAPEQATGGGIDRRADVHALAAVAYQLLTGHLVRSGSVGELAAARLPAPPSSLAPLPAAVDDVLLRALDPLPEGRYDDVAGFAHDLRATLAGGAVTLLDRSERSERPERPERPAEPAQETPAPQTPRRDDRRALVVMTWLLVLAVSFAAAYAVTTAVR